MYFTETGGVYKAKRQGGSRAFGEGDGELGVREVLGWFGEVGNYCEWVYTCMMIVYRFIIYMQGVGAEVGEEAEVGERARVVVMVGTGEVLG